jgi:flagellar assembly protein FliH
VTVAILNYPPAPGWRTARAAAVPPAETEIAPEPVPLAATLELGGLLGADEHLEARLLVATHEGIAQGKVLALAELESVRAKQRDEIAKALREFAYSRDQYFHQVEGEVVALALAIVRKILHREAQVEPMLLSGLVRVALEKMAASHTVRMRVHPSQIALWTQYFAEHPEMRVRPELSGDSSLEPNCCQIETEMGVTDLNLEMQLKEIEQGLFDLLAQRPDPKAPPPNHAG